MGSSGGSNGPSYEELQKEQQDENNFKVQEQGIDNLRTVMMAQQSQVTAQQQAFNDQQAAFADQLTAWTKAQTAIPIPPAPETPGVVKTGADAAAPGQADPADETAAKRRGIAGLQINLNAPMMGGATGLNIPIG